ncbi:Peroxisome membrane anchor protein Pex14p, N-terminal [Kalmanozyma brasiliensis GHG001]|uniref:Peroxisomal membrane protein PEX14 n=1 Tax=Kalmanozyma brasiliensis (strain GHG001) TaxID=1365824 RepID=V5E8P1_KALBG|nr:Peroxisome membrane anchor protein Pex14p, N-terminal [Kalmanozyma brasiliensis GHG001]EST06686.1 Peroxisome membrane anchor protein Pex14p, N-terminal [Kalmanozyma brasiliensis GHG001]
MADDKSNGAEASSSTTPAASSSSTTQQIDDRSNILAQATRFLTSANISESASEDDKREFLRSKGLTEDEITRAFQDAKSPVEGLHARSSSSSGDMDAFEIAARQFDDPINADALVPPPKSYPNSPLALYYDPPSSHPAQSPLGQQSASGQTASPLTRYQVLLQFFRTLSFMMMLGGGLTALLVSAYRSYILPKITAMFDARSIVLKHHIVLFDKLRSNVASLATYVPVQHARIGGAEEGAAGAAATTGPLKGVLKKVHFHDEVGEKEGVKSTQHGNDKSEKVVMPGTDVVVDAKTPLLSETHEGSDAGSTEEVEPSLPKMEPIHLMTPIRDSLNRLAELLKTDLSGRPSTTASSTTSTPRASRATTVADAGSGSDEWEDDPSDAGTASDDDGLEFDPYGAYQKKHKHTQSTPPSSTKSQSLSELKKTLVSLNADISTHAFAATSSSYAGTGGLKFGAGAAGAESPKSGDLGQVKAEIRSLKGLLLSRRNFPSYGARPPPLPASASVDARVGSAIV